MTAVHCSACRKQQCNGIMMRRLRACDGCMAVGWNSKMDGGGGGGRGEEGEGGGGRKQFYDN